MLYKNIVHWPYTHSVLAQRNLFVYSFPCCLNAVSAESSKIQTLHADVFYVCGKGFLLAIAEPMHYVLVEHLINDAAHE